MPSRQENASASPARSPASRMVSPGRTRNSLPPGIIRTGNPVSASASAVITACSAISRHLRDPGRGRSKMGAQPLAIPVDEAQHEALRVRRIGAGHIADAAGAALVVLGEVTVLEVG